jgi:signal transduction histidine kinase
VEVQPVIAEVFQKASRLVEAVDMRLDETVHASVSADRDYLVQLLFILVDNAIKYTPPGGSVTITSRVENGRVLISVRDTGVGIAPNDQARVFDRFYRSDPSRHGEGTGLGLSIARWIAQELGGKIELVSELGKGSTFTLLLPALPAMTSEHGQAVETAEATAAGH